jgi:hypothetical protein
LKTNSVLDNIVYDLNRAVGYNTDFITTKLSGANPTAANSLNGNSERQNSTERHGSIYNKSKPLSGSALYSPSNPVGKSVEESKGN